MYIRYHIVVLYKLNLKLQMQNFYSYQSTVLSFGSYVIIYFLINRNFILFNVLFLHCFLTNIPKSKIPLHATKYFINNNISEHHVSVYCSSNFTINKVHCCVWQNFAFYAFIVFTSFRINCIILWVHFNFS